MEYFLLPIVLGIAAFFIISALVKLPGRQLQQNFVALGILSGKTKAEIIASVGQPKGVSALPDGRQTLQWMATGYHICLVFRDDVCEGVTHEASA